MASAVKRRTVRQHFVAPNVGARTSLAVLILILACAVMTAAANLMMRYGLMRVGGLTLADGAWLLILRLLRQPTFVIGVLLYGIAAVVWFRVLSIAEVSSSYPILVGLTFILVTVGAVLWFRESLSPLRVVGIMTILAGIALTAGGRR